MTRDAPPQTTRFAEICAAMRRPGFYPHEPADVQVHETAISVVFVAGELAYKLKKPVALPFLDQRDPERRRMLCFEEVRLNRRLTHDTYLGVRAIVRNENGLKLAGPAQRGALDWAVEMRRLPEQQTMAALLEAGELGAGDVRSVARRIAAFHAAAESPRAPARPGAVKRQIDENFQPLLDLDLSGGERRQLAAAQRFFDATLVARCDTLRRRAGSGCVRDGHGDLRLEHVIIRDGGVEVFDCVEFDPALRQIDVSADLGYLVMDLIANDAHALADELVAAYRRAGGNPGDDALLAFFAAYRAWVRIKLGYLTHERPDHLVRVAERLRWRARAPLLLVICGVTASGKSTVAHELSVCSGLTLLASDHVRKQRAGLPPDERAGAEHYRPDASRETYRELGERARGELSRTGGAIVDATFRRREDRDAFAAAIGQSTSAALFVECRAPRDTLRQRARDRESDPARVSDATADLVDRQLDDWDSLDEIDPALHATVRADRDPSDIVDEIEAFLDQRAARAAPTLGRTPQQGS